MRTSMHASVMLGTIFSGGALPLPSFLKQHIQWLAFEAVQWFSHFNPDASDVIFCV